MKTVMPISHSLGQWISMRDMFYWRLSVRSYFSVLWLASWQSVRQKESKEVGERDNINPAKEIPTKFRQKWLSSNFFPSKLGLTYDPGVLNCWHVEFICSFSQSFSSRVWWTAGSLIKLNNEEVMHNLICCRRTWGHFLISIKYLIFSFERL